ncbi:MAG: Smr/MutS family protein [Gammaproteobacteria bacterium]
MSNSDNEQDDSGLFRRAVQGVIPLQQDTVTLQTPKPAPRPRMTEADELAVKQEMQHGFYDQDIETGDELQFKRKGIQHKVMQQLQRGQLSVQAVLDLHGFTVEAAKPELAQFLLNSRQAGKRCVRIIHGKGLRSPQGKPVLKSKLSGWLRQRDEVLAYCSARLEDGGTGAVYVLLKTL